MERTDTLEPIRGTQTTKTESTLVQLLQQKTASVNPLQDVTEKHKTNKPKPKINKVKTVRDIRNEYEKYVYEYLISDLDKQKHLVYNKIRNGSLRKDTLDVVTKILRSDDSIARTTWKMITNLNPFNFKYSKQYVSWNGRKIQISGSLGGAKDFVYNDNFLKYKRISKAKHKILNRKKSLLYNSTAQNFRPGPLSKKYLLDHSHQKYNIGNSEITTLPKVGLEVKPSYGAVLEPRIANYILGMREENGLITKKWAEFATSVVGKVVNNKMVQCSKDVRITFDVSYKNNQNRMLVRNFSEHNNSEMQDIEKRNEINQSIPAIVKSVVDKIIESVVISVNQNDIDYDPGISNETQESESYLMNIKDKTKKCGELGRLDVTIIRLAEDCLQENISCGKIFCKLGCICSSLQCRFVIRDHCGKEECMFNCTCSYINDVSKRDLCSNSELINLNNKLHPRLAKEEQKFQQTVVVSNDTSILLNSRKRNSHNYLPMSEIKNDQLRELRVSLVPLSVDNVQTFCMVHELYKCFCKNRFLDSLYKSCPPLETIKTLNTITTIDDKILLRPNRNYESMNDEDIIEENDNLIAEDDEDFTYNQPKHSYVEGTTNIIKTNIIKTNIKKATRDSNNTSDLEIKQVNSYVDSCCRLLPYSGRKYSSENYRKINWNIKKMEENDQRLKNKIAQHQSQITGTDILEEDKVDGVSAFPSTSSESLAYPFCNKDNLKVLIESHYKEYKKRMENGTFQYQMGSPKRGQISLYPWNALLERYNKKANYFFVTIIPPCRLYITVETKLKILDNCINTRDIKERDLHSYPSYIKNLVTQKSNSLEFCILYGHALYWELMWCIKKIDKDQGQSPLSCDDNKDKDNDEVQVIDDDDSSNAFDIETYKRIKNSNKWYMLELGNDYTQIRLCEKGFFVTRETLQRAIDVVDVTKKLKTLSPKGANQSKDTCRQFGIYIFPQLVRSRIVVGPYSMYEDHGIQYTIGNPLRISANVRGQWIILNIENVKEFFDNPLKFMSNSQNRITRPTEENIQPVKLKENKEFSNNSLQIVSENSQNLVARPTKHNVQPVKPKENKEFSNDSLHVPVDSQNRVVLPTEHNVQQVKLKENKELSNNQLYVVPENSQNRVVNPPEQNTEAVAVTKSPEAVIAKQSQNLINKNIKPIKINKSRVVVVSSKLKTLKPLTVKAISKPKETTATDFEMSKKLPVQTMHETSAISKKEILKCEKPRSEAPEFNFNITTLNYLPDVVLISDEEDNSEPLTKGSLDIPVWIQCVNIKQLGCLGGKKVNNKYISFLFPTYEPSPLFTEAEAFKNINTLLRQKVSVADNMEVIWQVVENYDDLINKNMLDSKDFGEDYILTKDGILHRSALNVVQKMEILFPGITVTPIENS